MLEAMTRLFHQALGNTFQLGMLHKHFIRYLASNFQEDKRLGMMYLLDNMNLLDKVHLRWE